MNSISCVIPTRNSGWSLAETLQTVTRQVQCNVRVIVVDSHSVDETLEICNRYGVEVMCEPPGNMYRAINTGLRACESEWLAYTSSDDMWYQDGMSRLIELGDRTNADVVYGVCDNVDRYGRYLHSLQPASPHLASSLFRLGVFPFSQQSALFRRGVFESLGGFDESLQLAADFDFYLRASLAGRCFAFLQGLPVSRFRIHAKQMSQERSELMRQELLTILAKNGVSSRVFDKLGFWLWRFTNLPSYLERVFRRSQLEGRLVLPHTMTPT